MKQKVCSFLRIPMDAVLIAIAALAVPCAVLTAYQLPFPLVPLIWAAVLIGILLSVWMHVPKFGWIAGIAFFAVLTPLLIWKNLFVRYGFLLFRYAILDLLSPDVPFLPSPTPVEPIDGFTAAPEAAIGWFALLVMAVFGLSIAWSLIRSKMILLPLIVPLPIFMLSLIYTDLPLAHWTVLLLLIYLGGCLIGGGLRVSDSDRYGLAMLPVLLGLLVLGVLIRTVSPPEKYEPISFERRQEIIGERVRELYDGVRNVLNNRVKRTEDLTDEEEWHRTGDAILEAKTSESGEIYLRAYSLGGYRNSAWYSVSPYPGTWKSMGTLGGNAARQNENAGETMTVHAEASEMLYVPYGFEPSGMQLSESYLAANDVTEYSWSYRTVVPTATAVSEEEAAYLTWAQEQYSISDSSVKEQIRAFAESAGIYDTGDNLKTARIVASFVRTNGTYSTTPGKVPEGTDFVLYFLEQSRTGYCVHFASATTAILQSFGIPARYVFGYRFFTTSGASKTVTDEMAHAWTEVYCPGVGWVPIESTAGADGWQEPDDANETAAPTAAPTPEPTAEPTPEPTASSDGETESEPTEAPKETNQPLPTERPDGDGTDGREEEESQAPSTTVPIKLWWLLWLLVPPAIVAALLGTGKLVRDRRKKLFRQKNAREAVLAMYRYQKRMERFGASKSETAEELAVEATFSDHEMSEQRRRMHSIIKSSLAQLGSQPKWKRFLYRHLLFLT